VEGHPGITASVRKDGHMSRVSERSERAARISHFIGAAAVDKSKMMMKKPG